MQKLKDSPDEGQNDDCYTLDELSSEFASMSKAHVARLTVIAKLFAKRCSIPHHDLLQEAYCRALAGTRTCNRRVSIIGFLGGVMRSLASEDYVAKREGRKERPVEQIPDHALTAWHQEAVSPEQAAISRLTDVPVLAEIDKMIEGDEQLQLLVEGIGDGMRGEELQDLLGVDVKGLAAARKRLKRALNAKFPERTAS